MRKLFVELEVDMDAVCSAAENDNYVDAISSELGWLGDSGMNTVNWEFADNHSLEDKSLKDLVSGAKDYSIGCQFLDKRICILTENADGELYLLKSDDFNEIVSDYRGDCNYIPSNDARIFFASLDGVPINPYVYNDFLSLMLHIRENWTFEETRSRLSNLIANALEKSNKADNSTVKADVEFGKE